MYHRVDTPANDPWQLAVSPDHFAEQLDVIRTMRSHVPVKQARPSSWKLTARHNIAITFDDGYLDNLTNALPLLEQADVPATFFITTGQIGSHDEFWWDELARLLLDGQASGDLSLGIGGQLHTWTEQQRTEDRTKHHHEIYNLLQPLYPQELRKSMAALRSHFTDSQVHCPTQWTMSEDELARFARHPLVTIGAHTVDHPRLSSLSLEEQVAQLKSSRETLQKICGRPVTICSYPFGGPDHVNSDTPIAAKNAGLQAAYTTVPATIEAWHMPYAIPRVHVPDLDGDRFSAFLKQYI